MYLLTLLSILYYNQNFIYLNDQLSDYISKHPY